MIFFIHLSLYLTVILLLFIINLRTYRGMWWVIWPAVFWGCSLIGHYFYAYIFIDIFSKNPMQKDRFERKALFYVHLIDYILTTIAFIVCDVYFPPVTYWFIYPMLGWGVGLFYHFFFIFVFRGWKIKKWKQYKTLQLMKKYYALDPFEEPSIPSDQHPQ